MYTLQENRITFRRMFRLAGLLACIWLLSSLLSPIWAQSSKLDDRWSAKTSSCYINKNGLNVTLTLTETLPVTIRLYTLLGEETQACCRDKIITPGTHFNTYASLTLNREFISALLK